MISLGSFKLFVATRFSIFYLVKKEYIWFNYLTFTHHSLIHVGVLVISTLCTETSTHRPMSMTEQIVITFKIIRGIYWTLYVKVYPFILLSYRNLLRRVIKIFEYLHDDFLGKIYLMQKIYLFLHFLYWITKIYLIQLLHKDLFLF
jgi:hypothetical protein